MDFERYVANHGDQLMRLAYVLSGDTHRAEDLTQTVLTSAYSRWSKVATTTSPHAYIRKMMVNAHLDWHRRRSSTERPLAPEIVGDLSSLEPSPDASDGIIGRDQLRSLVDGLPPRARTVLVLRYYADLDDKAIAEAMGTTPGTVRSLAARALSTLRTTRKESP